MKNAKTVGELMDRLALLPRDTPVHRRGHAPGSFSQGVEVREAKLATHEAETDYHADMSDRIWFKTKRGGFGEPFEAVVID